MRPLAFKVKSTSVYPRCQQSQTGSNSEHLLIRVFEEAKSIVSCCGLLPRIALRLNWCIVAEWTAGYDT